MTDKDAVDQPLDVAPFDLLSQKNQWEHVNRFHNTWEMRGQLNSKSRKDAMETAHSRSHLEDVGVRKHHTHTAVEPAAQSTEVAPLDPSKPMSATQQRRLEKLVDNDFQALQAEIDQMAADLAKEKRHELTKEWNDRGSNADAYVTRAQTLVREHRSAVEALVIDARSKGVELTVPEEYRSQEIKAKVAGLKDAISTAERDIEADRRRALNYLERARLTAQKKVLIAGITEEGFALLQEIPDARTLLMRAQQERMPQELVK